MQTDCRTPDVPAIGHDAADRRTLALSGISQVSFGIMEDLD